MAAANSSDPWMCFQEAISRSIPSRPCCTPTTYPTANPINAIMAAPLGSLCLSTLLLGEHLDTHPHVGVHLEHQNLGRVDPEVADVEGLLPLDDERTLVGGGDRHLALDRPGHAVEREVAADAVAPVALFQFGGLAGDLGEPPGVDAAQHLGVFELLPRFESVDRQLDLDLRLPGDVDAPFCHLRVDRALEPFRFTLDRMHARASLDPHSGAAGIDPENRHAYMSRSLRYFAMSGRDWTTAAATTSRTALVNSRRIMRGSPFGGAEEWKAPSRRGPGRPGTLRRRLRRRRRT